MSEHFELFIDALDFENKGGWQEDTQYVHLMGSGYLIAADEPGTPVADAGIKVRVPAAGRYRVWARTRNWLRPHDPGRFKILVNGDGGDNILGKQPSDSWVWEIAGDYDFAAGENDLILRDLTGYFARVASIIVTDDYDYVPPREVERIYKERARIRKVSNDVVPGGDYDVIVAGGGPGGVPAAIAAARHGMKTLLLQNRPMLGGNGSTEIGVNFDGAAVSHINSRESGIAEEIRRLRDRDESVVGDWTRAIEKLTAKENNLTVMCNYHVYDADMKSDKTIAGVKALNIRDLSRKSFTAKYFIDCTGDAWLGYYAGAKYRIGRESKAQHGERYAPETPDTVTMSGCLKAGNRDFFYDAGKEVTYHAPDWVPKLPEDDEEFGRVITGARIHWWLETHNDYDDIYDGEESRDALFLVLLGFYDHLKNHWSKKDRVKTKQLKIAGIMNGRRESRRLIGDYVVTETDCEQNVDFEDKIGYTGWALDIHHPKGIYSGKEGPLYCAVRLDQPRIPFRALYSVNIDNLLFAGRNVSSTHIALGTLRVQNTITTMGQAVGTAAAMCVNKGCTPRDIYKNHIKELQQTLLRDDQYIPGLKNEDPGDPCLTATVTASSEKKNEVFFKTAGLPGKALPLDVARMTISGIRREELKSHTLYLKMRSDLKEPRTVTVHANTEGDLDTTGGAGRESTARAVVEPGTDGWVRFDIDIEPNTGDSTYLHVWVEPAPGISWYTIDKLTFYRRIGEMKPDGSWSRGLNRAHNFTLKEPHEALADCSAKSVINGVSRIVSKDMYAWVSDPAEGMPQWIELDFKEPTEINRITAVFDTDMSNPGTCTEKFPLVDTCVTDYTVEIKTAGGWKKIADVKCNFMRRGVHDFDTVTAEGIKITVYKTGGSESARIIEIRAGKKE